MHSPYLKYAYPGVADVIKVGGPAVGVLGPGPTDVVENVPVDAGVGAGPREAKHTRRGRSQGADLVVLSVGRHLAAVTAARAFGGTEERLELTVLVDVVRA